MELKLAIIFHSILDLRFSLKKKRKKERRKEGKEERKKKEEEKKANRAKRATVWRSISGSSNRISKRINPMAGDEG